MLISYYFTYFSYYCSLSLSLSLSHTHTHSLKNLAPRKKLQRERERVDEAEKIMRVSEGFRFGKQFEAQNG